MQPIRFRMLPAVCCTVAILSAAQRPASAQSFGQGKWADPNDPVAKQLIEQERKWGVLYCTPSNIIQEFVADDFVGTAPEGPLYTKPDLTKRHVAPAAERDCKLLNARVRFYGPNLAIIYGSETAIRKGPDGKEFQRTLIWTDTALRRNGKWQLIAVQDMIEPKK